MKIKAQDGNIYEAHNVEMNACVIKCDDIKDRRKKHILGKYDNLKKACDIVAEIATIKTNYYEMPQN